MIVDPLKQKHHNIVLIYYLLLQDRIDEAKTILETVNKEIREECPLQLDYIECFIDICQGYPSFAKAR